MRSKKIKKGILLGILFLSCVTIVSAQTPGPWNGSPATTTPNAVGIGTTIPIGWQEIMYCDDYQKGLVISAKSCGVMSAYMPSYDGMIDPFNMPDPGTFTPPISYTLSPFNTITSQPMIWARMQNSSIYISPSAPYTSRFMVTAAGRSGFNIENPRATVDIKSVDPNNYPALIVGRQVPQTTNITRHVMFVPLCNSKAYNHTVQTNDYGIFFTDGTGTSGANMNGALVIAPWANNGLASVGGLRIDQNGNLAVAGQITTIQVNVVAQWWSDFVFDKDYKLASLESVSDYIKVNKHLPGIPASSDLVNCNMDLGDMEAKQMQKIEELTLYTIDQDKKLQQQQKEIDELKAVITKMQGK